ncbi:MAG: tetratricopeptide repeat protein [Acidobacteriota bacterium]
MKRWWLLAVAAAAVAVAAGILTLVAVVREPKAEWTTSSPTALEAYELGVDELAKYYEADAATHFERALELDPDFAAAKLQLLLVKSMSSAEHERRARELAEIETDALQPRERFLLEYWGARFEGQPARAAEILDAFLELYPEDPWAMMSRCSDAWEAEDWPRAEACYESLIDLHPNWVQAQNRLGLVAMAQGRFERAEERYRTYRFIAPDQAAPWDALGQLQAVRGEYEGAERSFRHALEVKGDFCDARWHLFLLYTYTGRLEEAAVELEIIEGAESCADLSRWGLVCSRKAWMRYLGGDLEGAVETLDAACLEQRGGFDFVAHRLALASADLETARTLEVALEERLRVKREQGDFYLYYTNFLRGTGLHLTGMRHLMLGDLAKACGELEASDELLLFWGIHRGFFKLFNLKKLADCRAAAGDSVGADAVRAELERINPRFLAEYRMPALPAP